MFIIRIHKPRFSVKAKLDLSDLVNKFIIALQKRIDTSYFNISQELSEFIEIMYTHYFNLFR